MARYRKRDRNPKIKPVPIADMGSIKNNPTLMTDNKVISDINDTDTPITPTIIELTPEVRAKIEVWADLRLTVANGVVKYLVIKLDDITAALLAIKNKVFLTRNRDKIVFDMSKSAAVSPTTIT
jgi:hypothetical protein